MITVAPHQITDKGKANNAKYLFKSTCLDEL